MNRSLMSYVHCGLPLNRIVAVIVFSALGPVILMTAPVVAVQYQVQLHLGLGQAGQLIGIEALLMSLATFPAYVWQRRFDWRKVAACAAILFIVTNVLCSMTSSFHVLLCLRAVNALASGSLMVISMSTAIDSSDPNRVYGLWVLGQLLLAAIGIWVLPVLFSHYGLAVLYDGLALLMLLSLPLVWSLSNGHERHQKGSGISARERGPLRWIVSGLIGILLFYCALSAIWTFMDTIAMKASLSTTFTRRALSLATLMGILGSLCATVIGERRTRSAMIVFGGGLMLLSIVLLIGHVDPLRYAVAAMVFKFSWTFALPFILASIASMDRTGSVMNSANIVIGAGLAIGPVLAGDILQSGANILAVLSTSMVLLLLAIIIMTVMERRK